MFLTALDILIVAILAYFGLVFLRRTHSTLIFRGMVALILIYLLSIFFHLPLTAKLFSTFVSFFVIILVVVFQRELRGFFEDFAVSLGEFFQGKKHTVLAHAQPTGLLSDTILQLAERRIGALLVLPGKQPIGAHIDGGFRINAEVSAELLLSIFDTNTPGHDGAVIIEDGEIRRFAAHLPLAERLRREKQIGTRHRAGLGLSERTDALVVIVSEERGTITLAEKGALSCLETREELENTLMNFYKKQSGGSELSTVEAFFAENPREKIFALIFAILAWYVLVRG